jgi:hypothetical protein
MVAKQAAMLKPKPQSGLGLSRVRVFARNVKPCITTPRILPAAADILHEIDENTVDLIVTSPPYADQKKYLWGEFLQ